MTRAALVELLEQSRQHNGAHDITGLLVYRDQAFVQVLEGERSVVEALYAKIAVDPRHEDVVLITSEQQVKRNFPDWSMGFHDSAPGSGRPDGYSDVLEGDRGMREESDLVRGLLDLFEADAASSDER
jgi:hypothetical protein